MDSLSNRFIESNINVDKCEGAWIFDKNGKAYVDYLLGNCCHILGHSHPRIIDAIKKQAEKCVNVGDHNYQVAYDFAEKVKQISRKDYIRLVNSGSEAVHLSLRLARAFTGRKKIVKFWGHYHGWFSEELSKFVSELPYDKGLLNEYSAQFIPIEWNNFEQLNKVFEEYGSDIAAVICEPVLCHAGPIPPVENFLEAIRFKTIQNHSLLIFDECITGLRLCLGGAQEYYNVYADIVVYSKAFSGGLPLGICAGKKEIMELLGDGVVYQAATYDANPLSVACANEVIDTVIEEDIHVNISHNGSRLISEIDNILNHYSIPHLYQGFPSVFQFYFTEEEIIRNSREAFHYNDISFFVQLVEGLLLEGVSVMKGDIRKNYNSSWLSQWFVSNAHNKNEIDFTLSAYEKVIKKLR
mgnify:CR=1 FL=1